MLFDSMYLFEYTNGEYIMKQGEEGINFYIVVQGVPIVTVADANGKIEMERRLGPGDTFGVARLPGAPPPPAGATTPARPCPSAAPRGAAPRWRCWRALAAPPACAPAAMW